MRKIPRFCELTKMLYYVICIKHKGKTCNKIRGPQDFLAARSFYNTALGLQNRMS